jgi:hypothetical protein
VGYSARYHAFSIIAIFTALAIGIVIGAGFGQDLVSDASEDLEQSLSTDLEEANQREEELAADLEREQAFGLRLYPPLVDSRLEGETIGVIAMGDLPEDLAREIEATIEPTGGELAKVAVVRDPPDVAALEEALGGRYDDLSTAAAEERLGRRIGAQLVDGGGLLDRVRDQVLARFSGDPGRVDNVILAKAPAEDAPADNAATERFEDAFLEGIRGTGAPAVAVELSGADPSSVPVFDGQGISTVDSLDLTSGKISAVFALLGSEGNFGIKETADSPLPDLVFPAPGQGRSEANQGGPRASGSPGRRGGN